MYEEHVPTKVPAPRPGPAPSKVQPDHRNIRSQSDRRTLVTYFDQHRSARFPQGRPWWGYLEIPADPMETPGVVGNLTPGDHEDPWGSGWEAPWYPDAKFLQLDHRRQSIRIRYDAMTTDYTAQSKTYYAAANKIAAQNGWTAPKAGALLQQRFIDILGMMPPSPLIPQAAQAGDPWLLGFSAEPNDQLDAVLKATSYGDFQEVAPEASSVASNVVSMPQDELQLFIASQVAKALAEQASTKKGDGLAKARAAKAEKKAQAAEQAA